MSCCPCFICRPLAFVAFDGGFIEVMSSWAADSKQVDSTTNDNQLACWHVYSSPQTAFAD